MRGASILLVAGVVTTPASAFAQTQTGPITLKPVIDARLRYEYVTQDGIAKSADAVTARVRAGIEAKSGDFAVLIESEGTLAIVEDYNSGVNGKTVFPVIADPQTIELNRAQVQYRGFAKTVVTVGRQRINLDDQRFVGSVAFRDNEQTFDAARIEWSGVRNLKADVTYARGVRTIWGIDGGNRFGPARYAGIGGGNVFANLAWKFDLGTLTGFAYLVDQDAPLILGNSSESYGGRFNGAWALSRAVKLNYATSYARQSDYARNPNRYAADYYAVEAGLDIKAFKLGGGYEVLGSSNGAALTSFQTPLATLHKFNGWTDKFLVTPPNGLRDAYGSIGYGWKKQGPFDAIAVSAIYHRFDSDRLGQHYGDEVNVQLMLKRGKYTALVKYADYDADRFATATKKLWLSLDWVI